MPKRRKLAVDRMTTQQLLYTVRSEVWRANLELTGWPQHKDTAFALTRALEAVDELLVRGDQGRFET